MCQISAWGAYLGWNQTLTRWVVVYRRMPPQAMSEYLVTTWQWCLGRLECVALLEEVVAGDEVWGFKRFRPFPVSLSLPPTSDHSASARLFLPPCLYFRFSTCGSQPFGSQTTLSQGSLRATAHQIFTLRFITVAKLQLSSSNRINFIVGCHHNMRDSVIG